MSSGSCIHSDSMATNTVVHRSFRILEVLRNIMEYVGLDDQDGSRTLVSLSLACHMFYDTAQDVLWRQQNGLGPLLACMPQAVWDQEIYAESNVFCFVRPPLPPEWTRFSVHAARVRSLTWNEQVSDLDEDIWTALALYRPATSRLIPHLRRLDWRDNCDSFPFVNLFLAPSVIDLTLGRKYPDDLFTPVLNALPHTCPHLERLRLVDFSSILILSDAVALPLLAGLPRLRMYEGEHVSLPGSALYILAHMPFLREVTVLAREDALPHITRTVAEGETLFPAIKRLRLHLEELDQSSLFLLRRVSSSFLRELSLTAEDPLKQTIIEHLQTLRERPGISLRKLSLSFPRVRPSQPMPGLDRSELAIDMSVFEHVFAFPKLVHIHITSYFLELDNPTIKRIVQVFPKLKTLRLLSNYYRGSIPRVTMEGITAIAQGCQQLEELAISFDTVSALQWSVPYNAPYNSTLRLFEVGDSPIAHPGPVAVFVTAIFSNPALEVLPDATGPGDNRPLRLQYATIWRDVQQMIMYMATARQQERTRLGQKCVCDRMGYADAQEWGDSDSDEEEVILL